MFIHFFLHYSNLLYNQLETNVEYKLVSDFATRGLKKVENKFLPASLPGQLSTVYEYDASGRVVAVTDPTGARTHITSSLGDSQDGTEQGRSKRSAGQGGSKQLMVAVEADHVNFKLAVTPDSVSYHAEG